MTILRGSSLAGRVLRRTSGSANHQLDIAALTEIEPWGGSSSVAPPWTLLCPENARQVGARDPWQALSRLPAGTPVTVVDDRPLSRWRLRRLARRAGICIERELIVLPTCGRPIAVVDDVESAVHQFWCSLATVPPGLTATAIPAAVALRVARSLPWTWTGAMAPGRVIVGRRT